MPLEARALIGWMPKDQAVKFLREQCVFDPALTDQAAEDLWRPYSEQVGELQRSISIPERLALNPREREWAKEAMDFYTDTLKLTNVKGIIKVDPFGLIAHQSYILIERANAYAARLQSSTEWFNEAVKPSPPAPKNVQIFTGPNAMNVDLPHGEFTMAFDPSRSLYAIQENLRYVTAWEVEQFNRMFLWAGYHRSYARMVRAAPDANVRSLLMVLADVGTVDVFPGEPNGGLRAILCGPNPPVFGDFFDERFFVTVRLRKKRFQLQVRASCVPIDDDSP
jgi:hypothetical protein